MTQGQEVYPFKDKGCLYIFLFGMVLPIATGVFLTLGLFIGIPMNIFLGRLSIWYGVATTLVCMILCYRLYRRGDRTYFLLATASISGFMPVMAFILAPNDINMRLNVLAGIATIVIAISFVFRNKIRQL